MALCLSALMMPRPGIAQVEELKPEPPLVQQMLQEGWTKVAEGVLQRSGSEGAVETFTYGEEGTRWTARRLEARLAFLRDEHASHPSEELAGILQSLETALIETDENLKNGTAQAEVVSPDEMDNCTISYWATAVAKERTGSTAPGTEANATAYFHSNCGHLGNSYAYAYARATAGTVTTTKTQEDPKYNGSWVDSAASATAPGNLDCYSEAYGRTWSPGLNINYEVSQTNYACPDAPAPLTVSISGPTDVWLSDSYPCETVTWTASASGGTPGYTYQWYLGTSTTVVGTGSSFSKQYCYANERVDVTAKATDSAAVTAQATFTTWIYYEPSCGSNCACSTTGESSEPGTTAYPVVCPYQ